MARARFILPTSCSITWCGTFVSSWSNTVGASTHRIAPPYAPPYASPLGLPVLHDADAVGASVRDFCERARARLENCHDFESKRQFLADYVARVVYTRYKVTLRGSVPLRPLADRDQPSIATALEFRLRMGQLLGQGLSPYGYVHVKKTPTSPAALVINEQQAEVVRLIFEMYASGCSFRVITRTLEQREIATRLGKKLWSTLQLRSMNSYIGTQVDTLRSCLLGLINWSVVLCLLSGRQSHPPVIQLSRSPIQKYIDKKRTR
jgi:hypothetical protein